MRLVWGARDGFPCVASAARVGACPHLFLITPKVVTTIGLAYFTVEHASQDPFCTVLPDPGESQETEAQGVR